MVVEIFGPDTHHGQAAQMAGQEHVEFRNTARPRVEVVSGDTVDHRASGFRPPGMATRRHSNIGERLLYCTSSHPSVGLTGVAGATRSQSRPAVQPAALPQPSRSELVSSPGKSGSIESPAPRSH